MKQVNLKLMKAILPILIGLFLSMGVFAQQITVKGSVKDVKGEPIIGANITAKGTTTGTISDIDGNFALQVSKGSTLVIKFIGYKTVTEIVNSSTIHVVMEEDAVLVSDVVVVGYAIGSKRTLSGAVQKVERKDMNTGVIANPLAAMKGKVAGVNIQTVGGDPTSSPSIRVRGTTSLTGGNDPLVIIDGVFGDLNMLNAISPSDIESFTVLKDASETAQYGSRGASGVIVVTTMKGKFGTKTLSYDGSFGVESVYKNLKMLSADQYRSVAQQLKLGITDMGGNTNFMDEMERGGYTQTHRLSFGGGNNDSNYRVSLGLIDQQGIIKNNDMRNYTAKFDAAQNFFNNKVKFEFGMFGSYKQNHYVNDYQKTFYSAASFNPTYPNHVNSSGSWDENANANEVQNPLGRLDINDRENNAYINTNARITWSIIDGLKLSAFGSYTYNVKENMKYIPTTIKAGLTNRGEAYRGDNKAQSMLANLMLTYKKDVNKHHIDLLGLSEIQKVINTGFGSTVNGFATDAFSYNNLKAGAVLNWGGTTSYYNSPKLASFMGRINYVYDDKYIATINARTDGSSKVGKNNKWGFFPSASLAWVINKEGFMSDIKAINNLKVRAGYGLTGNQDAIDSYTSMMLVSPYKTTSFNGTSYVTTNIARNANPDLKWEVKKTFDAGIDLGLFNNRITLTADYYYSKTTDMLYNYSVSVPPFAYNTLLANLGSMSNTGVELALGLTPIKNKDMELNINTNLAFQKNKLLSLEGTYNYNGSAEALTTSQYMSLSSMNGAGFIGGYNNVVYQMVGQPVGVFYLPKCNGLVDNGFGDKSYNVVDLNGNGVSLADGQDRYVAGQAFPKLLLGANISFRYKAFDIAVQMNGAFGQKIYNGTSLTYMNMSQFPTYNVMEAAPERNIKDQTVTDYWLEKGDYLHFDYVTLGWNIPVKKAINSLRVTFSVNNLATITNYSGLSPMINNNTVGSDLGMDDKRFYPLSRTFSLGLSVNF
jgi:TonB-linked SusC/RagA family outer membrane protein